MPPEQIQSFFTPAARTRPSSRTSLLWPRGPLPRHQHPHLLSQGGGLCRHHVRDSTSLLSLSIVPGTTRQHSNGSQLPCHEHAPRRDFYLQHSPRQRHLKHPPDTRAPGITPAASVLPRLVVLFTQAVTSLDQWLYVQGSRPGIVSTRRVPSDFWGQNPEAPPYPSAKVFLTRSGTVSACIHRQGPYAPFMVELFVVGFFGRTPSLVISPAACVATCRLPTAAQVERTEGILRSEPPGGISRIHRHHPFEHHGRAFARSVSVARLQQSYGIEAVY